MMGRTHFAAAIFAFGAVNTFASQFVPPLLVGTLPIPGAVLGLPLATLSGMLPDIDEEHSWISNPKDRVPLVGPILQVAAQAIAFTLNRLPLLNRLIGHRTITHSGLALMALGYLAVTWELRFHSALFLALILGFAVHLTLDAMTPAGIPLLWPIPMRFRFPVTFRADGKMDRLLRSVFTVGIGWLVVLALPLSVRVDLLSELQSLLGTAVSP